MSAPGKVILDPVSTFIPPRRETCKGCHLDWNIYSTDLERAFQAHEIRCVQRHAR